MTRLRINAMLSRIDHVGIAVRDLDEAIRIYERRLGLRSTGRERLEREGIEIAMIPIGESRIELIMPINPDSRVEKFLQDRGEAVHHVAYATDDVRGSLEQAGAAGAQLLDEVARPGSPSPSTCRRKSGTTRMRRSRGARSARWACRSPPSKTWRYCSTVFRSTRSAPR